MRILIISTFFPPMNSIASLRPYTWAKYWTLMGHDVTVLTTEKMEDVATDIPMENPGFKVKEIPLPKFFKRLKNEHVSAKGTSQSNRSLKAFFKRGLVSIVNTLRAKTGVLHQCRMPDISDLWVRPAIKSIKGQKWDLVVSTFGPYAAHLVGYHLKKHSLSERWIADYRDPWTNNMHFTGLFPFTWIENFLERKILRAADAVTTVSEPLVEEMKKKFQIDHVYEIANGFDLDDMDALDKSPVFPADNKLRLLYTGTIIPKKRNIVPLFEAIAQMKNDPTCTQLLNRLEVIVLSRQKPYIDQLVTKYGVGSEVHTKEVIPREEALRMQRDANFLIFLPWTDPGQDGILTGKLFEYLFSGTPIISIGATHKEASQKLIENAKGGVSLTSIEEIIKFLKENLQSPSNEKKVVPDWIQESYSRKGLANRMLDILSFDKTKT